MSNERRNYRLSVCQDDFFAHVVEDDANKVVEKRIFLYFPPYVNRTNTQREWNIFFSF